VYSRKRIFTASIADLGVGQNKPGLDHIAHLAAGLLHRELGFYSREGELHVQPTFRDLGGLHHYLPGFLDRRQDGIQKLVVILPGVVVGENGAHIAVQDAHHAGSPGVAFVHSPGIDVVRQEGGVFRAHLVVILGRNVHPFGEGLMADIGDAVGLIVDSQGDIVVEVHHLQLVDGHHEILHVLRLALHFPGQFDQRFPFNHLFLLFAVIRPF
jgi:hypothetical protein